MRSLHQKRYDTGGFPGMSIREGWRLEAGGCKKFIGRIGRIGRIVSFALESGSIP